MRRLPLIVMNLFMVFIGWTQESSPHGKKGPEDCSSCHVAGDWWTLTSPLLFDHDTTQFPLEGGHATVNCMSCHNLQFSEVTSECVDCHGDVHSGTVGRDCARCHTPQNWLVDEIPEIHEMNGFPLVGPHSFLNCIDCHDAEINIRFDRLGNDCINCHMDDFVATTDPNHVASGFSTDCLECHDLFGHTWDAELVDHSFFPLVGGHDIANCNECHVGSGFEGLTQDCFACHQEDYDQSTDPDHRLAGFNLDCTECHDITAWSPTPYDHSQWPLVGAHQMVSCASCHADTYQNTPSECFDCHQDDYNQAQDPDHLSQGFPTDCTECHTELAWKPANFTHDQWPLLGAHQAVNCNECHNDTFTNTPTDCIGCHEDDFIQGDNPDHRAANFSEDCTGCHDENGWTPADYTHEWPLLGAHELVDCKSCHDPVYEGTSSDCITCHDDDFNRGDNPDHRAANFSEDCTGCHDETGWTPADYTHEWPLLGAHELVDCKSCHDPVYEGTSSDCFDCHESDYNTARNPDHLSVRFPTDCTDCHNETAWQPSDFDHDGQYFPIYTGNHRQGVWNECTECHIQPSNFAVFSCLECHEHNRNDMADEHQDVSGYRYESAACLECHPNGESD